MLKLKETLAGTAALSLAMQGQAAVACTFISLESFPSNHMRAPCQDALQNRSTFLKKAGDGRISQKEALKFAAAFAKGQDGCRKHRKMAFKIADALLPNPLTVSSNVEALSYLIGLAPKKYDPQRIENARAYHWLLGESRHDRGLNEKAEQEIKAFLFDPLHWNIAISNFTDRPGRDQLVFRAATTPGHPKFSKVLAYRLGKKIKDKRRKLKIAKLLANPQIGKPNYLKAASLVDWYSPYINHGLDAETQEAANALWTRISQHRLGSESDETKAKAKAFFRTGIPGFDPDLKLEHPFLSDPAIIKLDDWPQNFQPMRNVERMITPNDYPSRSLRKNEAGRTEVGILFGEDGKFSKLIPIKSSGFSRLDEAAIKYIRRRFRPRIEKLVIEEYHGKQVIVPLPAVEWHIGPTVWTTKGKTRSSYDDSSKTLRVFAYRIKSKGSCGELTVFLR